MVYPAVLDLEEDVLDEADGGFRLQFWGVRGDFGKGFEDGYAGGSDPVSCLGDVPEAAVL